MTKRSSGSLTKEPIALDPILASTHVPLPLNRCWLRIWGNHAAACHLCCASSHAAQNLIRLFFISPIPGRFRPHSRPASSFLQCEHHIGKSLERAAFVSTEYESAFHTDRKVACRQRYEGQTVHTNHHSRDSGVVLGGREESHAVRACDLPHLPPRTGCSSMGPRNGCLLSGWSWSCQRQPSQI